ncbi:MAG: hypothetical protein JWL69_1332, partial [Phycisphaerales bacterium]|nr:hypothetical protein [Phycisphaerales bacterium]
MPYNLHIIRTGDFIQMDDKGGFDVEGSKKALAKLARSCVESGTMNALLDVRDAKSDLDFNDVYKVAEAFKEMGFRKSHRLAVLYRSKAGARVEFFSKPGARAEFFAQCAADKGWNVRAFDDYEQAIDWLSLALPAGSG